MTYDVQRCRQRLRLEGAEQRDLAEILYMDHNHLEQYKTNSKGFEHRNIFELVHGGALNKELINRRPV